VRDEEEEEEEEEGGRLAEEYFLGFEDRKNGKRCKTKKKKEKGNMRMPG
jgi:hypothetical protein